MILIRRLLEWLRHFFLHRRRLRLRSIPDVHITVDHLKAKFALEAAGERDGLQNYPAPGAIVWSDTEQRLANYVRALVDEARADLVEQHQSYDDSIASLDFRAAASKYANIPTSLEATLTLLIQKERNLLHRLEQDVRQAYKELHRFQRENHLDRLAQYPPSRRLQYGVFAMLVVIESGVNAWFFAKGNDFGLVGGFFQACLFAGLNVFLGAILGHACIRTALCRSWPRRLLGLLMSASWVALAFAFNLFVAHYRDAIGTPDPGTLAVSTFYSAPFGLTDFDSWTLLLVGCIWNLLAALDGFKLDDPYPGYGKRDRRARQLEGQYLIEIHDTLEKIERARIDALRALADDLSDLQFRRAEFRKLLARRNGEVARWEARLKHLQNIGNVALETYRSANRQSRTDPCPTYFANTWLDFSDSVAGSTRPLELRSDIEREASEAVDKFEAYRQRIVEAARRATDEFRSLQDLTKPLTGEIDRYGPHAAA